MYSKNEHIKHPSLLKSYIKEHSDLFWYIKEEAKERISLELLVETILSYGNGNDIKKLFQLMGTDKVAEIFYKQISRKRVNYKPRTKHFFKLYFDRHVQRNTN